MQPPADGTHPQFRRPVGARRGHHGQDGDSPVPGLRDGGLRGSPCLCALTLPVWVQPFKKGLHPVRKYPLRIRGQKCTVCTNCVAKIRRKAAGASQIKSRAAAAAAAVAEAAAAAKAAATAAPAAAAAPPAGTRRKPRAAQPATAAKARAATAATAAAPAATAAAAAPPAGTRRKPKAARPATAAKAARAGQRQSGLHRHVLALIRAGVYFGQLAGDHYGFGCAVTMAAASARSRLQRRGVGWQGAAALAWMKVGRWHCSPLCTTGVLTAIARRAHFAGACSHRRRCHCAGAAAVTRRRRASGGVRGCVARCVSGSRKWPGGEGRERAVRSTGQVPAHPLCRPARNHGLSGVGAAARACAGRAGVQVEPGVARQARRFAPAVA